MATTVPLHDDPGRTREGVWLPLVRALTEAFPRWMVLKNVASAFGGGGDLDTLAPREDWHGIERVFRAWAEGLGFAPVVVCRHRRSGPNFFTFDPAWPYVVQLDVMDARPFRSQPIIDAHAALDLGTDDPRGFRVVREGAQGLMNLCSNGSRRGGGVDWDGIRAKRVIEMLEADPVGVRMAAKRMRPPTWALERIAAAACRGSWDRAAMLAIEWSQLARGVTNPVMTIRQGWYRDRASTCPIKRLNGRRVPDDRATWLRVDVLPAHHPGHGILAWPAERAHHGG
jgi:hypothetical protein